MIIPTEPIHEDLRLNALDSLHILDTPPETEFDEITELAAHLCDVKISLICLVDRHRQWVKSRYGLEVSELPKEHSFCAHNILHPEEPLIVHDATRDERFKRNSFVTGEEEIKFYVGIPLIDKNGFALGTLCVLDSETKILSKRQLESLHSLAHQVVILFELNSKNKDLERMQLELEKKNESLKEFARVISHDLKMPLANVITTSDLLKLKLGDRLDEESKEYFGYIKESSFSMSSYINDILDHYESDSLTQVGAEYFKLNDVLKDILILLAVKQDMHTRCPQSDPTLYCNKSALKQIFFNLIGNSIKYNDKDTIRLDIQFTEDFQNYYFRVTDNGMGIPKDKIDTIFELFKTANTTDRNGNKGNGIGLSTVKKLVENLGGTISVSSIPGEKTVFDFSMLKIKDF
ncbi:GAF domain-containing sensor histidine kinase [Aquimarina sp. ERC-38]|uniref:sensor histidine kinase n=1 Tax=Aquimarina sp. ERC-38 TaxID=2949996 RepID=UPI0022466CCD|nr:GAF domain-containing sensor histidine kinase [Aquimarina sp. ERC-38]UZO79679.1 GAF domain-containing sensor histidine kinase [Aquimarina sp. ERC-38]